MLDKTPTTRVQALLDTFGAALESGRIEDAANLFAEECYWRDLVAFTWNIKTVEGRDQVRDMLEAQLSTAKPSGWRVAAGEDEGHKRGGNPHQPSPAEPRFGHLKSPLKCARVVREQLS